MSLLALITARGGSKGIPNKNIKELCGKPLIAWTIETAKKASFTDRIVVSTDDKRIAKIALDYGAEVPFLRPPELARDDTPGIDTILHALEKLPEFKQVIQLQPTSPLRTFEDIEGICHFQQKRNAPCVVSVCAATKHPYWTYSMNVEGFLEPFVNTPTVTRRQELPPAWVLNGAIYLADIHWLQQNKSFLTTETLGYPMPPERSADLDTPMDWEWVEFLMSKRFV